MKRFLLWIAAIAIPAAMSAQAQITTKKVKIEDFPGKITKIVLTGNMFFDSELQDVIKNGWTISPYEFCSLDEFNSLKGSSDYYFLLSVHSMFRKETSPGIDMLSLVKGGEGASKGIDKMLEIVSVPLCSSENPSGREFVFLGALIDIMQQVTISMKKDLTTLNASNKKLFDFTKTKVIFSKGDLAFDPEQAAYGEAVFADEEEADSIMEEASEDIVLSYLVAPSDPQNGSFCYKMLIHAKNHTLYYFRKQKITASKPAGFLSPEVARLCVR